MEKETNNQQSGATSTTKNAFNLFAGLFKWFKKLNQRKEASEKK